MSDWRDVMNDRTEADRHVGALDSYGGMIEDGRAGDSALATMLAARAICAELRALSTVLDYNGTAICSSVGRP